MEPWQVDLLDGRLAGQHSTVLVSRGIAGRLVGQLPVGLVWWCVSGVLVLWQDLHGIEVVGWGMWWYAVYFGEEAGWVVVLQNLCSMFTLAVQSSRELASGGACRAYQCGLKVLWAMANSC